MKYLNWNPEKNQLLAQERGICFEEIACLIEEGKILAVEENPGHPNQKIYVVDLDGYAVIVPFVETEAVEENPGHPNQKIYVVDLDGYAVIVPFVETEDEIFLKTAFPSRKYSKKFGLKEK